MRISSDPICKFKGDVVSYIYGETCVSDRSAFESHLLACTDCTDELAAVSFARYSVYEWHKEEFALLATPEIVIPYPVTLSTAEAELPIGPRWVIPDLFAWARWPAAAAALIAVVIAAGLIGMAYLGGDEQQMAANVVETPSAVPVRQTEPVNAAEDPRTQSRDIDAAETVKTYEVPREVRSVKPLKKMHPAKTASENATLARSEPNNKIIRRREENASITAGKVPVLNSYEDSDDLSLRLTDLVDDEGTWQ